MHTRVKRSVPNPPPYEEAAEQRTVTVWACRVCGHAWEDAPGFDAEKAARACHAGVYPRCGAEGCPDRTAPHRTLCEKHLAEAARATWEKRPVEKWDGEAMIYSDALDEWFQDPDAALEKAADRVLSLGTRRADDGGTLPEDTEPTATELREELEAMRLGVGVPVRAPYFDLGEFLSDLMPSDEYGDGPDTSSCGPAAEALNAALEALPPLSWTTGKARLDLTGLVP
jgi:hypothetical protein